LINFDLKTIVMDDFCLDVTIGYSSIGHGITGHRYIVHEI